MRQKNIYSQIALDINFDFAVTLHFERNFATRKRTESFRSEVQKYLKIFIRQMNQRLYGKKSTALGWKGQKISVIPVIENFEMNQYRPVHLHLSIGNIPIIKHEEFNEIILKCWGKIPYSRVSEKGVLVERIFDQAGWKNYISKEHSNLDSLAIQIDQMTF